jgi:two-component system, OmpR family, response regulator MtrA
MQKLLVIDDEAGIAEVIGLAAEQLGLQCQTVQDPSVAAALFIDYHPDIVILDLIMPGKDGIAVLHEILATGIPAKIVLTSGFGDTYMRLAQGVAEFHSAERPITLKKPFRRHELVDMLRGLIAEMPSSLAC